MDKQTLVIFKFKSLFKIIKELEKELNFDVIESNSPYKGNKLHLSMNQKPYYVDDD